MTTDDRDELIHTNAQLNQCLEEIRKASNLRYDATRFEFRMAIGRIKELLDHYVPLPEPEPDDSVSNTLNDIPF